MSKGDLIIEIGTEELPPKALAELGQALQRLIVGGIDGQKLPHQGSRWYATPRRLAVLVQELAERAADQEQEVLGPPEKVAFDDEGKPTKAALAFASKNALDVEDLQFTDTPKGKRLVHRYTAKGIEAAQALPDIVTNALAQLPIPKRMRWGANKWEFVRPVQWLLMLHGNQPIACNVLGAQAGGQTYGHRFHHPGPIAIESAGAYAATLETEGRVLADFDARREAIRRQLIEQADQLGGGATAVIDAQLLDEVTALVEWPVAMTGEFDKRFLEVPAEALISSMAEHQKYFHVVDEQGELLPHFIFVANIESNDPAQVIAGNEKVIRPRLADAAFFYETDRKTSLESRCQRLAEVVFQEQLGSVQDKSRRTAKLARFIAKQLDADLDQAERAALLAKADLVSELVFEFDKLQGIAGYYYALNDGEPLPIATAIKEQYLPRFAGDELPGTVLGDILALADRLDTLVGIFGINQPPSGSKDPFALRRAALGVIRIMREKQYSQLDLNDLVWEAKVAYGDLLPNQQVERDVTDFIFDRYRAMYQEEGIDTNTVLAVQDVLQGNKRLGHNPFDVAQRIAAVQAFQSRPEAEALSAANKRVKNILAKQSGELEISPVKPELFATEEEAELNRQLLEQATVVPSLCEEQRYAEALHSLASLGPAVDSFFDNVMVMDENPALQRNRINLLGELRNLFLRIADISQLQGK